MPAMPNSAVSSSACIAASFPGRSSSPIAAQQRHHEIRRIEERKTALGHGRRFGPAHACFSTAPVSRPSAGTTAGPLGRVEDGRGSLGHSASLRFPSHRVTGGGRPPPAPTERGVRISRTNALRQLLHSTSLLFVQVSFPWSADLLFE